MSSSAPPSGDSTAGLQGVPRAIAITSVLGAMALVVLSAAITNATLPALARSLHVTPAESVRAITAYQLALVMALLPGAALGESLGPRRVFFGGVALFSGASVLCALAPSMHWLVAARFAQGLGGAAVMALGVALLRYTVSPSQLAAAIGWNALTVALSSAAGPTLGALVLSRTDWPWLFALNLPLGAAVLLATRALPDVRGTARTLDLVSVALNAGAFAALVFGCELLPTRPAFGLALIVASALSARALVRHEAPRHAPLFPLDLLRVDAFRGSVIASVLCFTGQTAALLALPFYLQHGLGRDVLTTAVLITPWPLSVAIAAPIAGRLSERVATSWLCAVGGALLALGLLGTALWPVHGQPLVLVPFLVLSGLGFGLFQVPNNRTMFLAAPRERSAAAGGMQGTARLLGQTTGAVVMTVLFKVTSLDGAPRIGLGVAAALTLAAGLVSLTRR